MDTLLITHEDQNIRFLTHTFFSLSCLNETDAHLISLTMYGDFVTHVHRIKEQSTCSPEIRNCLDYIMLHIEEPMTIDLLAKRMGYTPYYFARKFHQETGRQLNEYIRTCRAERSKLYLETSELSIQQISDRLHFSSRTHYTDAFRTVTGTTPAKWRRTHRFR